MRFALKILAAITIFCSLPAWGWENGISFGAGGGEENGKHYQNSLYMVNGKFYKFKNIDRTLIATIDGRVSFLRASTAEHNSMYTISLAPALRAYFLDPAQTTIRPYLEVTSGPVYLSQHQLGEEVQGADLAIQTTLGGGVEFVKIHGFEVNFQFVHYCNAGLASPNEGFNFPFVISFGYLW